VKTINTTTQKIHELQASLNKFLSDRNMEIYNLRKQGETFGSIAKKFKLSDARCWSIFHRVKKIKDHLEKSDPIPDSTKPKKHKHYEVLIAIANLDVVQYCYWKQNNWRDWNRLCRITPFSHPDLEWRVKPCSEEKS
jgi:hypothetical protein